MYDRKSKTELKAKEKWLQFISEEKNRKKLERRNIPLRPDIFYRGHFNGYADWLGLFPKSKLGLFQSVKQSNYFQQTMYFPKGDTVIGTNPNVERNSIA